MQVRQTTSALSIGKSASSGASRRHGLNVRNVHFEPDEAPDGKMWAGLKALLKDHPAKAMVWEGEPLKEAVEKLRALGLESVVFDPCGNVPEEGDFLDVMRSNLRNLDSALAEDS